MLTQELAEHVARAHSSEELEAILEEFQAATAVGAEPWPWPTNRAQPIINSINLLANFPTPAMIDAFGKALGLIPHREPTADELMLARTALRHAIIAMLEAA